MKAWVKRWEEAAEEKQEAMKKSRKKKEDKEKRGRNETRCQGIKGMMGSTHSRTFGV